MKWWRLSTAGLLGLLSSSVLWAEPWQVPAIGFCLLLTVWVQARRVRIEATASEVERLLVPAPPVYVIGSSNASQIGIHAVGGPGKPGIYARSGFSAPRRLWTLVTNPIMYICTGEVRW